MRIALINSGLGLLAAAAELRRQSPGVELILAMDPDGMPWGSRTPDDIAHRSLACAHAAAAHDPDAIVFACNTGSVHALDALRAEFEPRIPVVGTVPAVKPAAAAGRPIAIWATAATTGSAYQHALIAQFAAAVAVTEVPCPGLADAINAGDEEATATAVAVAAARTPAQVSAVVLGCTEYELAAPVMAAARPGVSLHGSARAVAAQTLRRVVSGGADYGNGQGRSYAGQGRSYAGQGRSYAGQGRSYAGHGQPESGPAGPAHPAGPARPAGPALRVLLSGRPSDLPPAALRYREGRFLVLRPDPASRPDPADSGFSGAGSSSIRA
jgi:glutamate racemase